MWECYAPGSRIRRCRRVHREHQARCVATAIAAAPRVSNDLLFLVQVFRTAPLFHTCGSASIAPRLAGAACWPHPIGPESNRCVRSDLRVVALAFAADSSTLQSPVDVKERKAATPKKKAAAPKPAKPAVATAASKKRFVSDDEDEDASYEDNAPKVKPKKKPTAAPKPAAAPAKPTAAAPKPAAPVKPTAAAPKPAAAPKKQAAPKARAPRATASKSKKHVVSDDEDYSDEDDGDEPEEQASERGG